MKFTLERDVFRGIDEKAPRRVTSAHGKVLPGKIVPTRCRLQCIIMGSARVIAFEIKPRGARKKLDCLLLVL